MATPLPSRNVPNVVAVNASSGIVARTLTIDRNSFAICLSMSATIMHP
jgi:hypothetical protein